LWFWNNLNSLKKGMAMQKIIVMLICLALFGTGRMPLYSQTYSANLPSKAIHIVYDDSGSMIRDDGDVYLDRWAQAKYAMEVFAAMLQENDIMRVYYMSDYVTSIGGNITAPPRLSIMGTEPMLARAAKVHDTITLASNTPFDPVLKAYEDLKNETSDEKWLVVLTDGQFNFLYGESANVNADGFYSQFINESDIKIIHFAMGNDAAIITADPKRNIFFEHSRNDNEILGKIISVCNQIFNRNTIRFNNEAKRQFSFDLPMRELLVFVQGADIGINGIIGESKYEPSETVNVRYSEVAAINYANNPNVIIPRNLTGVVAVFRDIPQGRYELDVTGAQLVEIYYKPAVNLVIRLYRRGREINSQDIPEGNYRVRFGLAAGDGKFVESSLLGKVEYQATVQNRGQTSPVKSGDIIKIHPGELRIQVEAHFLEINTAGDTMIRTVNEVTFFERYKYLFLLLILLSVLLFIWLLWGRKKRFPKYMVSKPSIIVENDENTVKKFGSFRINPKTKWLPLCPETGTIIAAADGKPLPRLRVKAIGNERMELTNTGDFSPDRLNGVDFFINDQPLPEGSARNKEMSCTARIKSVYYNSGIAITHTCSFPQRGRRRRR
jgi:hypothetical protein